MIASSKVHTVLRIVYTYLLKLIYVSSTHSHISPAFFWTHSGLEPLVHALPASLQSATPSRVADSTIHYSLKGGLKERERECVCMMKGRDYVVERHTY